jgi:hypothetical protein
VTTTELAPFTPPAFVEPTFRWVPPGRRGTFGPEIVDFTNSIGHGGDAEQDQALDDFGSYGPGGHYLTFETCLIEGRQNGKTDRVTLRQTLFDFFIIRVDRITWTAHLMDTTRDVFTTVENLIEENASLSARVKEINRSKSEEAITLTRKAGGGVLEFRARVAGGGRGKGGSIWVGDEWLFGTDESIGARMPTLRARTNAQIRYVSSAARHKSKHLRTLIKRGRSMADPNLIYVERCAPGSFEEPGCDMESCTHAYGTPGCTLDREELWHLANHQMGRRITYAKMRSERASMPPTEFACEGLGWHEPGDEDEKPVDPAKWAALAVEGQGIGADPWFFLDCSPGLRSASIAGATLVGGRPHVKLADYRAGADWVPARAEELRKKYPNARWQWEGTGPASALEERLRAVGVTNDKPFTGTDMARGCTHVQKLVNGAALSHSGDQAVSVALASAVKRDIGDPGLWSWGRRTSTGDISPLVAVTGALWWLETGQSALPAFAFS